MLTDVRDTVEDRVMSSALGPTRAAAGAIIIRGTVSLSFFGVFGRNRSFGGTWVSAFQAHPLHSFSAPKTKSEGLPPPLLTPSSPGAAEAMGFQDPTRSLLISDKRACLKIHVIHRGVVLVSPVTVAYQSTQRQPDSRSAYVCGRDIDPKVQLLCCNTVSFVS